MTKSIWDEFTNLYSLTKTLRFELKPHPKTKSLIDVIKKDKEIDRLYNEEMKPMFDELHETFINESLQGVEFLIEDLEKLEKYYVELKELKHKLKNLNTNKEENKNEIKNIEKKRKELDDSKSGKIIKIQSDFRDIINKKFDDMGENWKKTYKDIETELTDKKDKKIKIALKGNGVKILEEENILALLAHFYPEKINDIKKFKGFFTYFSGFNQNRANYYVSDQKATGIANRIININLNIFIKNKNDFDLFFEKLPEQLTPYKNYFQFKNYRKCLTQEGIDDYNDQVGEVKKIVNLEYNQQQTDKKNFLTGLNKLQKQIGCKTRQQREQIEKGESLYPKYLEKIGRGFHITRNEQDDYQVWECLDYLSAQLKPKVEKLRQNYLNFFQNWQDYKLDEIWFRKESLNTISAKWFGGQNWAVLTKALAYLGTGKIEKEEYKIPQFISLLELKDALAALEKGVDFDIKKPRKRKEDEQKTPFTENHESQQYVYKPENLFRDEYKIIYQDKGLLKAFLAIWENEISQQFEKIKYFLSNFEEAKKEVFDKKKHTKIVFDLMQNGYLPLIQFTKYHNLEKKGEIVPGYNSEDKFYDTLDEFWEENPIIQYRNAFQATLTQKPYSKDKIKLNFDCGYLLGGWSSTYETYGALIFQRNDKFYLGLINGTGLNAQEVKSLYEDINEVNLVKRLVYNAQKIDFKNCPRWFINSKGDNKAPAVEKYNLPVETIWDDYQEYRKLNKKGKSNYIENNSDFRSRLIDYYQYCLPYHESLKEFKDHFSWKNSKEYKNLVEFYTDVINSCYKLNLEDINFNALKKLANQERIYLFQIYNKDFEFDVEIGKEIYGENSKTKEQIRKERNEEHGKSNLHTKSFLELLKPENTKYLKLLGGGEIFYREASKEKKYKQDKKGKKIIDAKRYYEDKYFLHFPIEIKETNKLEGKFNQEILKCIFQNRKSIKIIGIDRGEKHLMYYSVVSIDESGNAQIVDQGSFNRIETKTEVDKRKLECKYDKKGELEKVDLVTTGKKVKYVDYHLLLDYYEKNRIIARKNWEVIGKIKDLKGGYLSQVIYQIYKMILKHNAIVVMEDLNTEFKAKRGAKVEKAIYKKFELNLAKKLNHLILKDENPAEIGGVLRPYQLTPKIEAGNIENFENAKQWGTLFYVQPHYTSTTDPLTGWRKHLYISNSATKKEFDKYFGVDGKVYINYDFGKSCFKFSYKDKTERAWHLHAFEGLNRFHYDSKNKQLKSYDLFKEIGKLFSNFDKNKSINEQILEQEKFQWKTLIFFWNLLNQIRNTDISKQGNENDFLQSPVWSKKYRRFFDSRKVSNKEMPQNGDANGAYNIARKGILMLKKIAEHAQADPEFNKYPNLFISNAEWDKFVQSTN